MVQTVHLQFCSSLRLLHVLAMLTVCFWLLCSCRFTNSVLVLPCTGVNVLLNTFIPGANSGLVLSAGVQG